MPCSIVLYYQFFMSLENKWSNEIIATHYAERTPELKKRKGWYQISLVTNENCESIFFSLQTLEVLYYLFSTNENRKCWQIVFL